MKRRIYIVLPTIAAILFAWSGVPAEAADPDLPPVDPPFHWRYVTQDPATTSSQCIGDPKTPECVVDTYTACYVREDARLCAAVGITAKFTLRPTPGRFRRYRISSSRRLTATSSPPYLYGVGQFDWRPGDIELITHKASCAHGVCGSVEDQMKYVLRKNADRWSIVDKGTPRRQ